MASVLTAGQNRRLKPASWSWNRGDLEPRFQNLLREAILVVPCWQSNPPSVAGGFVKCLVSGAVFKETSGLGGSPPSTIPSPLGKAYQDPQSRGAGVSPFSLNTGFPVPVWGGTHRSVVVVARKSTSSTSGSFLAGLYVSSANGGVIRLRADTGVKQRWEFAGGFMTGTVTNIHSSSMAGVNEAGWHVFGLTVPVASAVGQLYLDGNPDVVSASTNVAKVQGAWTNGNLLANGADASHAATTDAIAALYVWDRALTAEEHALIGRDPFGLIRPRDVIVIPSAPAPTTTVVTQGQNRLIKPGRWAWTPSSLDPWARELAKDTLFLSPFQGTDKAQDLITKEFSDVVPASGWFLTQAGPGASNNGVPEGVAGRWTNNTDRFNPFPYSGGAWPTVQGGAFVMWRHQGQQGNFAAPIAWRNTPTTNGRWNILEDAGGLMYVGFNGATIVSAIPWLPKTAAGGDLIAMFISWDGKSRWLFGAANLTKKIRYFEIPTTPAAPTGTTVSNQPLVIGDLPASTNNTQYGAYVLAATFRKWITTPLGNRLFDDPFALIRPRDVVAIPSAAGGTVELAGSVFGGSSMTGEMVSWLSGSVTGGLSVAAQMLLTHQLSGLMAGGSSLTAQMLLTHRLSGAVNGLAEVAGGLSNNPPGPSRSPGQLSATLTGPGLRVEDF